LCPELASTRAPDLSAGDVRRLSKTAARQLVSELLCQRAELESQNEELRQLEIALRESQDALMASEERYRDLYDLAPVAYLTLSLEGTVTGANLSAARLLEVPNDGLEGRKFSDFVHADHRDRWHLKRKAVEAGEQLGAVFDLDVVPPGGRPFQAELALVREEGEGGEPSEMRVALLDVSSRRRVERARLMSAARELLADQDDRRRLAEQLHGGIEQSLALAGMKLGALRESHSLQELEELDESIRQLARQVADFGQQLFPTALSDLGIVAASQWLVEEMARRSGVVISAPECEEIEGVDLLLRIVLFRSLREILETLSGQEGVAEIRVGLRTIDGQLQLVVTSPGIGFDDEQRPEGVALLHTRDRLEQFGGRLDLRARRDGRPGGRPDGRPEEGIRIVACLPLPLGEQRLGMLGR
jgi:PAS domain S-box-containing protein